MQFLPWNSDDLQRYSRALVRAYPTMVWWQVGMKTWETMLAAPQVVAQRTARMVAAGPFPGAADRREFTNMGAEKLIAFSQAWINAAREAVAFQQQIGSNASQQWWLLMRACNPLVAARSARAVANPAKVVNGMVAAGNRALSTLPRIAHGAVSPVHAKATSNAKRLRRRT
jgi:hypothetical protein